MDFIDTREHSLLADFFPKGWDMSRIDACCAHSPESILERQPFWHDDFAPISCANAEVLDMMTGHEIAHIIRATQDRELVLLMTSSPMSMYNWTVYFLAQWGVDCRHVHTFLMNEWSDKDGKTMDAGSRASFQYMVQASFFGPLKELTVPLHQRNFATQSNLPEYPGKIKALKDKGALVVTACGIGRMMQIALWEPQFAAEFAGEEEWKAQQYRKGAKLHPLTVEQYALTRFAGRTTQVPCFANTIGPGLFLQSDLMIGGCGGSLAGSLMWQAMPLWTVLRHGPSMWIPASFMPTLPGKLFFHNNLAGPLGPICR